MSATDYSPDDLFTIRTVKHLTTNPLRKWQNSYELKALVAGGESELLAAALTFVEFERRMANAAVVFEQVLISTWEADSKPYNPEAFISTTLALYGTKTTSSDPSPLTATVSVARVCASGRFGHIFLRGWLEESIQNAPAGMAVFTNLVAQDSFMQDELADSGAGIYFGNPADAPLGVVMVSKDGSQVRNVLGLSIRGISQLPLDHAWFNRTAPVGP